MNGFFQNKRIIAQTKDGKVDLKQLFFGVEARPLYWEVTPPFMGSKPEVNLCNPRYYAILSNDEEHYVFSAITQGYVLITNKQAYDFGYQLARMIFHVNEEEDFICVHAEMTSTRGACQMDMKRRLGVYQPLMNQGWCAFMRITNSYNKTKTLKYDMGFYNFKLHVGILDSDISLSINTPHYSSFKSYKTSLMGQVNKKNYNIERIEQMFLEKIKSLESIDVSWADILPLFCKVYKISIKANKKITHIADLIRTTRYIEDKAHELTSKYGQNAYALLNVFAVYEQDNGISFNAAREKKFALGEWVDDIISKSKDPNFSLAEYIGPDAYNTSTWLRTLGDDNKNQSKDSTE